MKSEVQTYVVTKGSANWGSQDLFQNRIPHSIIIGLVASDAYHGNFKKNCFNFAGNDLQNITVLKDGQSYPRTSITCNYNDKHAMDAYTSFISATGASITYNDYLQGYALYAYNMQDDLYMPDCHTPQAGNLSVNINFKKALPKNLSVIIYAKFTSHIAIDSARNITIM
jgi:hypothetical protein